MLQTSAADRNVMVSRARRSKILQSVSGARESIEVIGWYVKYASDEWKGDGRKREIQRRMKCEDRARAPGSKLSRTIPIPIRSAQNMTSGTDMRILSMIPF